jgi:hypothetical protein
MKGRCRVSDEVVYRRIRQELYFYLKLIEAESDEKTRNIMKIILSRTTRSCRATTHFDLAT